MTVPICKMCNQCAKRYLTEFIYLADQEPPTRPGCVTIYVDLIWLGKQILSPAYSRVAVDGQI